MKRIRLPFIDLYKKSSLLFAFLLTINLTGIAQATFSTVANAVNTGANCYTLTTAVPSQKGAVWYNNKINLNYNFDISFTLNFGNISGYSGGDGMAFVLQPVNTAQIGYDGSAKGYGNTYDANGNIVIPGISPSIDIEYDTYDDFGGTTAYAALLLNGDYRRSLANTGVGQVPIGFVNDGQYHTSRVTWNVNTKTMTLYFDGVQKFTYTNDIINSVFSGQNLVYFGFTGATGGSVNQQSVCIDAANSSFVNGLISPFASTTISSNVTCHGAANGKATVTVSGGVTPYRISVDGVVVANNFSGAYYTINNLLPGNHTITATDAASATSTNNVFVSEPALPVITASGPTTFCAGGSVDLSASAAGKSLQFNSLGKYVEAPSTPAISLTNALTVEAWVKTDLTDRPQYIVSKGRDDLMNGQYGILIVGNIFQFHLYQTGHQGVNSNTTIQPGVWYHVAGTWDGVTAKIYVNGVLDNSAPFIGTLTPNAQALEIGRIGVVNGNCGCTIDYPFYGEIDEIRIWNSARTASEINTNKNITVAASPVLVAYYSFDEGSGSLASDAANGNTATLLDAVDPPQWMVSGAPINYATYAWSPGSAVTPTFQVTSSGSYVANVTSGNGCSYQTSPVIISVTPTPTISASGSLILCSSNSVVLTASTGTAYSWSNGATTQSITVTQSGNYTVSITNTQLSCSATSVATVVTVNPPPVISGPTAVCVGSTVGLTATPIGGIWSLASSGTPGVDQSNGPSGNQSGGTFQWQSFTAGVTGELTSIDISHGNPQGNNGASVITVQVYTGAGVGGTLLGTQTFTYPAQWGSGFVNYAFNGVYLIQGQQYTFLITTPVVSYSWLNVNVNGGYPGGNFGPYIPQWDAVFKTYMKPTNASINSNGFVTGIQPGSATVNYTFTSNGCTGVAVFPLAVNAVPTATITASGSLILCSSNSVVLTASTGTAYSWSNGATTQSITVTPATVGSFTVTVFNEACSATSAPTVVSNAPDFVSSITASGPTLICNGSTVTLTLNEPVPDVSRSWYRYFNNAYDATFTATGMSIQVTKSGNYGVNIIDANGCYSNPPGSHDVTVLPAATKPLAFIVSGTGSCTPNSGSVSASIDFSSGVAPINMTWDDGKGFSTHAQSINNVPAGIYTATVYDYCGTTEIKTFTVTGTVTAATITATSTFLCTGNSSTVSVSNVDPLLTYQWYVNNNIINGATGTSYVATTAGNYQVLASNGGCSAFSNSIIINAANPTPLTVTPTSFTNGVSCFNGGGSASANFSGGTAPHTFMGWTGPNGFSSTSYSIGNLAPGVYTATQRDFCGVTASGSITIVAGSALILPAVTASAPYCNGNAVTLTLGPTPYTFEWGQYDQINEIFIGTFSPNQSSIVVSAPGYYYYPIVKDANGCYGYPAGFETVKTPITVQVNTSGLSCNGPGHGFASLNYSGGSGTLTFLGWSDANGNSLGLGSYNSTYNFYSISNLSAGTYKATVQDACGTSVANFTITDAPIFNATITASGPTTVCAGGSLVLTLNESSPETSHRWFKSVNSVFTDSISVAGSITVNSSGFYGATVVAPSGCYVNVPGIFVNVLTAQASALNLTVTGNNSCGGPSSGSAFANFTGAFPITVAWTNNGGTFSSTSSSINNIPAGTYTATVTDVCGNMVSKSVTISGQVTAANITATSTNICSGSSSVLNITNINPALTYQWRNNGINITGQTGTSYAATVSGNYSVTASNGSCATTSSSIFVTVQLPPSSPFDFTVTSNNSCNGTNHGNASANAFTGGVPGYTFLGWSNGAGFTNSNSFINNLPGGVYTYRAKDFCGTLVSKSVTIIEPAAAIITINKTAVSLNNVICGGGSGILTANSNGNPVSYNWNNTIGGITTTNIATTQSISVNASANYSVSVKDANGCLSGAGINITAVASPVVFSVTIQSSTICQGQSTLVTLSGSQSGVNYTLYQDGVSTGRTFGGNGSPIIYGFINAIGSYTIIAATNQGSCSATMSGTANLLLINPAPVVAPITQATNSVCVGSTIQLLDVTTGGVWLVQSPTIATVNNAGIVTGNNPGNTLVGYQLTDANGCKTIVSVPITVNVTPAVPVITAGGSTTFCPGGSLTLTSLSDTGNVWSNGANSQSIIVNQTGNYNVTVTGANGCSATSASLTVSASDIIPPVPSVSTLPTLTLLPTDVIPTPTATDNCTSGVITGTTSDQLANLTAGTYTIHWTYTDNSGNPTTQTQTINIIDNIPPAFKTMNAIVKNNDAGICGAVVTYSMPLASDNVSSIKVSITEGGGDGSIEFNTPVTNNVSSLDFISTGQFQDIVHGHGVDISVGIELFNPQNNGTWTRVQTIQTGTGDYHFGGTSAKFTAISQVSKIRFVISQPVYAAFHVYDLAVNLNSINVTQTGGLPSGSLFPIGKTINTFSAVDMSGNVATTSFTVTINDAEKPAISNYTESKHNADANGSWTGSASTIVIKENCPSSLIVTEQYFDQRGNRFYNGQATAVSGNYVLGTRNFPLGVNTVSVTVTDAAGNKSDAAKFTVTILDVTNPTIVASGNITQSSDPGVCGAYVKVPVPVVNDNCSIQSVVNSFNGGPGASGRYPVGTTILTWTVTDGSGNKTITTQTITITDNEPPVIINLPVPIIQTNDAGTCGAVVTWAPVRATDNCGVLSFTSNHQSGETFLLGVTTITFTATDKNNNITTASFTITITDNEAPKVITKPATIILVNGSANLLPADINNGSSDNCGAVTLLLSKTNFTCANTGINQVTLTVTDSHGNSSSATAIVTVVGEVPTSTILVTPSNTVYTGGVPTDIYLGYGPQSVTLTANVLGITPITYLWAGGVGLNCVSCQNPVFTPTVAGLYTFTVTATNKYGCSTTSPVSICVRDIRVTATANSKVYVCHTDLITGVAQTLTLAVNAVANQLTLNPQDVLGSCGMLPCTVSNGSGASIISNPVIGTVNNNTSKEESTVAGEGVLSVTVSPNPSATVFTLKIHTQKKIPVHIRVIDESGRVVEGRDNAPVETAFAIGTKLITGMYFAEILQGKERVVVKLIKQNR